MAAPTFNIPFDQVSSENLDWVAAFQKWYVELSNDKFPNNQEDSLEDVTAISNNNGNAQLTFTKNSGKTYDTANALNQTVKLVSFDNDSYNVVARIIEVNTTDSSVTLDIPFLGDEAGQMQWFYSNYSLVILLEISLNKLGEASTQTENRTLVEVPIANDERFYLDQVTKEVFNQVYRLTKPERPFDSLINDYQKVAIKINLKERYQITESSELATQENDSTTPEQTVFVFDSSQKTTVANQNRYSTLYEKVMMATVGDSITINKLGAFLTDQSKVYVENDKDAYLTFIVNLESVITTGSNGVLNPYAHFDFKDRSGNILSSGDYNIQYSTSFAEKNTGLIPLNVNTLPAGTVYATVWVWFDTLTISTKTSADVAISPIDIYFRDVCDGVTVGWRGSYGEEYFTFDGFWTKQSVVSERQIQKISNTLPLNTQSNASNTYLERIISSVGDTSQRFTLVAKNQTKEAIEAMQSLINSPACFLIIRDGGSLVRDNITYYNTKREVIFPVTDSVQYFQRLNNSYEVRIDFEIANLQNSYFA